MKTEAKPEPQTSPIPGRSLLLTILIDRLRKAVRDNEAAIPWERIEEFSGEPRRLCYGPLRKARRLVLKEYGVWFAIDRGLGLQRADSRGVLGEVSSCRRGFGRRATRAQELSYHGVKTDDLTRDEQTRLNAEMAILGVIRHASREKSAEKVARIATVDGAKLAIEQTLEAMKRKE